MTPHDLAALHAACFETPRPWTAVEFLQLMNSPHVFLICESGGFALGRVVADEAELLTLAVRPDRRRQGIGQHLIAEFIETAKARGAVRTFLEVSSENTVAIGLYEKSGFHAQGRRRGYFRTPQGHAIDALVMTLNP